MMDSIYGGDGGAGGESGGMGGGLTGMELWTNPIFLLILACTIGVIVWGLVAIGIIALISAMMFIKIMVGVLLLVFCLFALTRIGESGTYMLYVGLALGVSGAILLLWGLKDAGAF